MQAYPRSLRDHRPAAGVIKSAYEDFVVEEIPLFRPSGHGPHTIVQIEKRGTATFDALLFLSKTAKVSERVIGYAGLKDARAIARQYVSLPKVSPERVLGAVLPCLEVAQAW